MCVTSLIMSFLIFLSFIYLGTKYAGAVSGGYDVNQYSPYTGSPVGSSSSDIKDLPVCVDAHPTPDLDKILILWQRLNVTKCSITVGLDLTTLISNDSISGHLTSDIVPNKQYNISVVCIVDQIRKSGTVQLQKGKQDKVSSECTKADWLKKGANNNLTICVNPLNSEGIFSLTYNATSPMEKCYLVEFHQTTGQTKQTPIHVLPFAVSIHPNSSSNNSSFSVKCLYPPLKKYFTAGPVWNKGDKPYCSKKFLVIKDTDDTSVPRMSPVHQRFVTVHMGLFAFCIVAVTLCIALVAAIVVKKLRLHHRRQGQRLLVNEDGDEAAFREYREMES